MSAPEGIESLEGVVANAKPNATVTMPAGWIRELLVYVRELEATVDAVCMVPDPRREGIQTMSETTELPADLVFLQWLIDENGYQHPKLIGPGRYACICRYAYTVAILVGPIGDKTGFSDRWCYHDLASAKAALDAWDGKGEPDGWHRQPGTGRRRSVTGDEIDDEGNRVGAIGVIYVRG